MRGEIFIWVDAEGSTISVCESFLVIFTVYEVAETGLLLPDIKEFISSSEVAGIF